MIVCKPDAIKEKGLLDPKGYGSQSHYLLQCLVAGYVITTYLCREIGIHNLHSQVKAIRKRWPHFEHTKDFSLNPDTNSVSNQRIIHLYMTPEQRAHYLESKKPAKA